MLQQPFRRLQSSTSIPRRFTHHYPPTVPALQVLRSETPGGPRTFYLTNFVITPYTLGSLLTMSHGQSIANLTTMNPFLSIIPSVHYPTIDHQPYFQHIKILPLKHTTSNICSCPPAWFTSISSPLTSAPPTPTNCSMHYQSTAQLVLLATLITNTVAAFTATYSTVLHRHHNSHRLPLPTYSTIHLEPISSVRHILQRIFQPSAHYDTNLITSSLTYLFKSYEFTSPLLLPLHPPPIIHIYILSIPFSQN